MPTPRSVPMRADMRLPALERWFQDEVVGRTRGARAPVGAVILPGRTLSARARLDVYSDMYLVRLEEALRSDYVALRAILGDGGFRRLSRAFLTAHPSRHWSLNPLGRRLPAFIAESRMARRGLLADIARLENAMSEVFDEQETAPVTAKALAGVEAGAWPNVRLAPIAAFRLLALDHDANAIVGALRHERPLPPLRRRVSHVAVYRNDFVVYRLDLSPAQFAILEALSCGKTVRSALKAAIEAEPRRADLAEKLFIWFRDWTADGFFRAVGRPPMLRK